MIARTTASRTEIVSTSVLGGKRTTAGVHLLVVIFILGMCIPLFINLGPVRLTVYRIVLLALFFPALYQFFSGSAGKLRLPDFCVIGICVWSSLSLAANHGLGSMVESIGIVWVETLGAYLIGRVYIRTPEAFHAVVRMLFWLGMLILPLAIIEAVTSDNLILLVFDKIGPAISNKAAEIADRLGLNRVQGPFDHPILFGVFFGSQIGLVYYVLIYGKRPFERILKTVLIALTAAFSLSAGPLIAMSTQLYLILWDQLLNSVRRKWYVLSALAVFGFFVVYIFFADRTPFHTIVTYLSFSQGSAYNRILIWTYGIQNISNNPIFGIGFGEWVRPSWMSSSIDMFWIVGAVRHGILVWILWLLLVGSIFLKISWTKRLNPRLQDYRTGYLITLFGVFMAGWTVHFWNALFVYFMFLLGSGLWMADGPAGEADTAEKADDKAFGPVYSRFSPRF